MPKHTQEPWEYIASTEHHGPYVTGLGDIADCYVMSDPAALSVRNGGTSRPIHMQGEQADDNARRIVACVNACAGISTEALEAGVLADAIQFIQWALEEGPPPSKRGQNILAKLRGQVSP